MYFNLNIYFDKERACIINKLKFSIFYHTRKTINNYIPAKILNIYYKFNVKNSYDLADKVMEINASENSRLVSL